MYEAVKKYMALITGITGQDGSYLARTPARERI